MADDNSQRFDILLTGATQPDIEPSLAAARLAELFRITPERAAQLLQGRAQRVKAGVDRATALRYRDALQRTGALFAIRAAASADPATATAAISATAARASPPAAPAAPTAAPAPTSSATAPMAAAALTLAEPGTPVLTDAERPVVVAAIPIGDSALTIAPPFAELPDDRPQPAAPDTSHLSLRGEGELLDASERRQPANPVLAPALSLAEPGAPLETLTIASAPLAPAIDHLDLAPPGAALLNDAERAPAAPAPPPGDSASWRLAPVKASFGTPGQ